MIVFPKPAPPSSAYRIACLISTTCLGAHQGRPGKRFSQTGGRLFWKPALGAIFGAVREINTYVGEIGSAEPYPPETAEVLARTRTFLLEHGGALGLMQEKRAEGPDIEGLARLAQETGVEPAGLETSADDLVELLLEKRQAARKEREFALSDQIRDGLAALGVRVEDVRDGYRWRFER